MARGFRKDFVFAKHIWPTVYDFVLLALVMEVIRVLWDPG